nr:MAG TPA: hypothetical protein [Caudoviricetes sp.]
MIHLLLTKLLYHLRSSHASRTSVPSWLLFLYQKRKEDDSYGNS